MFDRFTDRSLKVFALAKEEAARFGHEYIGTEHLLLALTIEGTGVGANVLKNLDVDLQVVQQELERFIKRGSATETARLPHTRQAKEVVELAIAAAKAFKHSYVGTEHLIIGLISEADGIAGTVLRSHRLTADIVRSEVAKLLGQ